MEDDRRVYRIEQLGRPQANGIQQNEEVDSLEGLVTHHPGANRNIRMQDATILQAENPARRSHGYISGDFEEVIDNRVDRYGTLQPGQMLLVKDFILEDPSPPRGTSARAVDVPSPTPGYVSSVRPNAGFVEIMDREDGVVIARLRHLSGIAVAAGDTVAYGQSLGQQDNVGLNRAAGVGMHVHIEMDTGHYQQFRNYMSDLANGRLPVQAQYRVELQPLPVVGDGTFRLGQSGDRVRDLQHVMAGEGYVAAGDQPLDRDGVYRPAMQGALLDFQRAHGAPQTGDIDPATLRMAPAPMARDVDRNDTYRPGQRDPLPAAPDVRAPGHPEHHDHRPALADPLPPPVNQPRDDRRAGLRECDGPLMDRLREQVRALDQHAGKPWDDNSERLAASALFLARQYGFTERDDLHLAFNVATEHYASGELLHLARLGPVRSPDPAANLASMRVSEALSAPVHERYQQVLSLVQSPPDQLAAAQQRGPAASSAQDAPVMSMSL